MYASHVVTPTLPSISTATAESPPSATQRAHRTPSTDSPYHAAHASSTTSPANAKSTVPSAPATVAIPSMYGATPASSTPCRESDHGHRECRPRADHRGGPCAEPKFEAR